MKETFNAVDVFGFVLLKTQGLSQSELHEFFQLRLPLLLEQIQTGMLSGDDLAFLKHVRTVRRGLDEPLSSYLGGLGLDLA